MIIIRKRLCKPVMGQGTTTQCLLHYKQSVLLNMSLSYCPYWLLVLTHLHSLSIYIYNITYIIYLFLSKLGIWLPRCAYYELTFICSDPII